LPPPRIIAGTARGRRLKDVPGDITRPITDRVKEALFNILAGDIVDATLLDLFAGTGSVGIEALSRGAEYVRFNDVHRQAIDTVKANLETTGLKSSAEVVKSDAFTLLRQHPDRRFDYIFIAPPQYKGLWRQALEALDANPGWLTGDGWLLVQIDPVEYQAMALAHFSEIEQRRYGSTLLVFYEAVES
jgi:16S rRNA (guanine(966)-N(2))-methyltransferase RsmD